MTEVNTCKKCSRKLPSNYKHKQCESCRNRQIGTIRKIGADALKAVSLIAAAAILGKKK